MATVRSGSAEFDRLPFPAWVEDERTGAIVARNYRAQAMGRPASCALKGTRMRRFPMPAIDAPASLVVMEPDSGDSERRLEDLRGRIYEAIARHEPVEAVFSSLVRYAEDELPGTRVVIFQLAGGCLRAHATSTARGELLAALDGLAPDGPRPAPWWRLRGRTVRVNEDEAWAPFRAAAQSEGVEQCWSELLITAAGEVVGTLTLLLPRAADGIGGRFRGLDELQRLAALALEQHHLLEELYFLAQRDPLTGLLNRMQFGRLLGQGPSDSAGRRALVWLELTGFGRVNSILGSLIGDAVLCAAARRLEALVSPADILARVGGDEFAVLLSGVSNEAEAITVAQRLQGSLTRQFEIRGHSIQLAATAGVSFSDSPNDQPDLMLRRARMAMECADRNGAGSLACFEPAMHSRGRDRMELERLLRNALPRREFALHYQPQFCLRTGLLSGCEALLRWRQPDVGLVSPSTFIPVAEELGVIVQIGAWVLKEACRQGKQWLDAGHPVRVGVNVSPHQFRSGALARQVEETLAATALPPELLELEITESVALDNLAAAVAQMRQIRSSGVTFALDDFGSGQSSLAWLRDLPVQRMKIDRRFVQGLGAESETPILQSIIHLAHELNLAVIVEGIETEQQFERVRALGCDDLQGYLRGWPMDPARFASLFLLPKAL